LTTFMPCGFGPPTLRSSGAGGQQNGPLEVTVTVR
jgi:hypothetical protein